MVAKPEKGPRRPDGESGRQTPNPEKDGPAGSSSSRLAVSSGQAARYCLVTATTIANWIAAGRLRAQRTVGGQYRIRVSDLRCFMRAHGMRTDVLDEEIGHVPACWEYWGKTGRDGHGEPAATCADCPVFRSRAEVCHEVRPLLPGGTRRALNCSECDYLAMRAGCPGEGP